MCFSFLGSCLGSCVGASASGCLFSCCSAGVSALAARYVYGIFFLVSIILAWIVRDVIYPSLSNLEAFSPCKDVSICLASEGVLRVCFSLFLFFFVMILFNALCLLLNDGERKREVAKQWNDGWWSLKMLIWLALMVVPYFMPSGVFHVFAVLCIPGGLLFFLIQLVCLLNFMYVVNDAWLEEESWHSAMVVVSLLLYALSLAGIVLEYIAFAPSTDCGLNIFFITFTLVIIIAITAISVHPEVNAGPLTSGILSLYLVFLCYSSIMSQPSHYACNTRSRQEGRGGWNTAVNLGIVFLSIVYSVYATSVDGRCFRLQEPTEGEGIDPEEETLHSPYSLLFFHFVFAMGSMYAAMVFVGWDLEATQAKFAVDSGWASVWVKMSFLWFSALLYTWTMIAPFALKDRSFY